MSARQGQLEVKKNQLIGDDLFALLQVPVSLSWQKSHRNAF